MGFWSRVLGTGDGETPNSNGPDTHTPGDPQGFELLGEATSSRSLPFPVPSPWSGYPSEWSTPQWSGQLGVRKLVDTAWACIDLNASILSTMPAYRMQSNTIVAPKSWMINPDPRIYASWNEFCKQLFWDYLLGEAFVLSMADGADGWPLQFRVIPPWLVNVELVGGVRRYNIGSQDVTDSILHIRYSSNIAYARGIGPLEVAGARMTTAALLQRYADKIAETGGTPLYWIEVDRRLTQPEADDLLDRWVESRIRRAGEPALVTGGAGLHQGQSMNAKDMTLLELAQFSESRIAVLLGVPPFLVALPEGDALTYKNVSQLFDYHDRLSLRPKAEQVMAALSYWALPRGQVIELNRDEYSRPDFATRATAYAALIAAGVLTAQDVRSMERLHGDVAAAALSGVDTILEQTPIADTAQSDQASAGGPNG